MLPHFSGSKLCATPAFRSFLSTFHHSFNQSVIYSYIQDWGPSKPAWSGNYSPASPVSPAQFINEFVISPRNLAE